MQLISTRNKKTSLNALEAVLMGIARDGGLFVPSEYPKVGKDAIGAFAALSYAELSAKILHLFFDELSEETLLGMTQKGYASFDDKNVAPLRKINAQEYVLELWHGPTLAFKDMALQVLPGLLKEAREYCGEEMHTLILVATSGDTGKAALEGFRDAPGVEIAVFYPEEGVSNMQKLQMVTQEGDNTHVAAVRGNFDDAQTGVKEIFADSDFASKLIEKGYSLSSANSINFGRLAPQIAYYFSAYASLLKSGEITLGEEINFVVPTGNFGNILAAYYAYRMGLPIHKLICASNRNNVLTDFFQKGEYKSRREFYKTSSPSMDILISSNLERLLFEICDRDEAKVSDWMKALKEQGVYHIDEATRKNLSRLFYGSWSDEAAVFSVIRSVFDTYGYLMDPHTAVAQSVYEAYAKETGDTAKTVVVSTASPYKFCADVQKALGMEPTPDDFAQIEKLYKKSGLPVPKSIAELKQKPVRHTLVADKKDMKAALLGMLGK
jgi:threonine synthase